MAVFKQIVLIIVSLTFTACGLQRGPASFVHSHSSLNPVPIISAASGAEDGFTLAMAAYQAKDGETGLLLARQVAELLRTLPGTGVRCF